MPKGDKMSAKQQLFCEEYLVDLNGVQAAIRAGYSVKGASVMASNLLTNNKIAAYIGQKMAERSKRTGINADRVLQELAKLGFANITDIVNTDDATIKCGATNVDTAAIASIKVKTIPTKDGDIVEREIKLNDKIKSLELLGKNLGIFTDKLDINADVNINIDLSED